MTTERIKERMKDRADIGGAKAKASRFTKDVGEKTKHFFLGLQSLPDDKKQNILIVSIIVVVGIVFYFWMIYFNTIVVALPKSA